MTSHETGATPLYHGQVVSFEWQSRQARFSTAAASAGTVIAAPIARAGSVGGFVRAGRIAWMPAIAARNSRAGVRIKLVIDESRRDQESGIPGSVDRDQGPGIRKTLATSDERFPDP